MRKNPVALADYRAYCRAVSDAYDDAPLLNPDEVWRWKELAKHAERFFRRILSQVDVEFVPGDPYETADQMRQSVERTGVLYISTEANVHPVFTPKQNLKFRAVHDYVVHILPGEGGPDFSQRGEMRAYNLHRRLAPPDTWPALFTEVAGQACYHSTRGVFPEQKVALLPFDYYNVGEEMKANRAREKAKTGLGGRPLRRGTYYDGEYVHVAFNIAQCKPGRPLKTDYCYTVAPARSVRTFGKPEAYVDQILLEDPVFMTNPATLRKVHKRGRRDVFAWVAGTVRDPNKASVQRKLGNLSSWKGITACPFTHDTFMIATGPQGPCHPGASKAARPGKPIHEATWAFFDLVKGPGTKWSMKALAMVKSGKRLKANAGYQYPVRSLAHLETMAEDFGGDIE